jgi:hypothetical protein
MALRVVPIHRMDFTRLWRFLSTLLERAQAARIVEFTLESSRAPGYYRVTFGYHSALNRVPPHLWVFLRPHLARHPDRRWQPWQSRPAPVMTIAPASFPQFFYVRLVFYHPVRRRTRHVHSRGDSAGHRPHPGQ